MARNIFALGALVLVTYISSTSSESTMVPKIHSILSLLPKERIEAIEKEHLKNDLGFRSAVYFLQGNEWRDLVNSVVNKPEYQKFAEMAKSYDIDIAQGISCIRKHIDSIDVTERHGEAQPNLESFINDVQAVLPITEIAHALSAKLGTPEGQKLRAAISSEQNKKLADDVYNLPEMVKMRELLKGMKFDVDPYIALVYTFLGWVH